MPGEDYQSWSTTAANNGTSDSAINWAEGQARASVNNSSRSELAAHAKNRNLLNGSIVTGGTASAQSFTSGVGYTTVPTGLQVLLKIGPTLTSVVGTPTTLNMDGIGAVGIKNQRDEVVEKGLVAGTYAHFLYNGTNWIWLEAELLTIINNSTSVIINQTIISTSTTGPVAMVDLTDLDTSLFARYHLVATDLVPEINSAFLNFTVSNDNGVTFPIGDGSASYNSVQVFASEGRLLGGEVPYPYAQFTSLFGYVPFTWPLDAVNDEHPYTFLMDLFAFQADKSPTVTWTSQGYDKDRGEYAQMQDGRGFVEGMTGANAIRIWLDQGNIVSGTFTLYGYN